MDTPGIPGPIDEDNGAARPPDDNAEPSEPTANRNTSGSQRQPEPPKDTHARARRRPRGSRSDTRRKRPQGRIPSQHEFLFLLTQLTALTGTGQITAAQNNAMRANVLVILSELRAGSQTAAAGGGDSSRLRDELRRNPDLLEALAPILTDAVLHDLTDDEDGNDKDRDDADEGENNDPDHGDDTEGTRGDGDSFAPRRPK
jgi:hypothetical protein